MVEIAANWALPSVLMTVVVRPAACAVVSATDLGGGELTSQSADLLIGQCGHLAGGQYTALIRRGDGGRLIAGERGDVLGGDRLDLGRC